MTRKLTLAFLTGCAFAALVMHLVLSYAPAKAEIWHKGQSSLIFNRHKDAYPYWWAYSYTRNKFAGEFREELERLGWTRVIKDFRDSAGYDNACYFEFFQGGIGNAAFKVYKTTVTRGEYTRGQYAGERVQSSQLKDLRPALEMC